MAKKLFTDDDFDKVLHFGDELVFDKPELEQLRIELVWKGTDLDLCAFLLGSDGQIHKKEDLVYFNSKLRWKPEKDFNDPNFNPLKGSFSKWPDAHGDFKNQSKWMEATLPISEDGSVIGSWDDMTDDPDADCGERMHVLLNEVDSKYTSIVFAAAVAQDRIRDGETFADAHNPVVTIFNAENDDVLAEYELASEFPGKDTVCFGRMDYDSKTNLWSFVPMEDGYEGGMQYIAREVYN